MLRHGAGKNPCPEPPFAALSEEVKIGHAAKEAAERIRDIGDLRPVFLWRMTRYRMASSPLHAPSDLAPAGGLRQASNRPVVTQDVCVPRRRGWRQSLIGGNRPAAAAAGKDPACGGGDRAAGETGARPSRTRPRARGAGPAQPPCF